jgi:hypothetical protein
MEIEAEIGPELLQEERSSATPAPRGRPWPKGQSGNPQGRPRRSGPSRAHKAAYVAHSLFDRKTARLVERAIGWAEGGDKAMLRAYLGRIVPPRGEVPVWLNVPAIESRRDVMAALRAVGNAVAQGEITSAQGLRLVRLYTDLLLSLEEGHFAAAASGSASAKAGMMSRAKRRILWREPPKLTMTYSTPPRRSASSLRAI